MNTWTEIKQAQPLAGNILTNSIEKNRLSHAYLIAGSLGTGKRSIALQLAKTILCESREGTEPCQQCLICRRINSKNHPDVYWVEPEEKGSILNRQIDELQKEFIYSGLESRKKVYVVTHAETLTVQAANRILKFLEEPSDRATAILLTKNIQSILPTIRSRCQIIDLQPLSFEQFSHELIEYGISESNIRFIYAITNDISEAKRLLEDEWFAEARKLMLQLIEIYLHRPNDAYLFIHHHWLKHFTKREEHRRGLELLLLAFKDFLYNHIGHEAALVVFQEGDERLEKARMSFSEEQLLFILQAILDAQRKITQNVHPSLVMEQLTFKIKR
ncbi:MAG TPA: DNA polymerase III subunit delta' [Bacillota bacterium]|nr:DNA polymerase III subunit delta' [Bacillota bacterium]